MKWTMVLAVVACAAMAAPGNLKIAALRIAIRRDL